MCEVCNKNVYFDTTIHHSDAGYGDDDWDEKFKSKVVDFICPACGKLKPAAIKLFGSETKALMHLMVINMRDDMSEGHYFSQFQEILELSRANRFDKILELNDLKLEQGKIVHKCGHILISDLGDTNSDYSMVLKLENRLKDKSFNFCPCCGDKLIPLKINVDTKPSDCLYIPNFGK